MCLNLTALGCMLFDRDPRKNTVCMGLFNTRYARTFTVESV